jgi:hypothetical protein
MFMKYRIRVLLILSALAAMVSSCMSVEIPKDLDLSLEPRTVPVQDITFSFDSGGELINSSEKIIEVFLAEHLSEITGMVVTKYGITLDEEEFFTTYKKSPQDAFKPSDHYMKQWFSWTSKGLADFRSKITIYDSAGILYAAVDINKGGSREFPAYSASLPIDFKLEEEAP